MHNNFYFLRQLSRQLEVVLKGAYISECFSQQKDELIIRFEASRPFYVKASLLPAFSCLSFPKEFNRTRKNSIDLFPEIIGRQLTGVRQFENERSFSLLFEDGFQLLFKLHGNRSNLIVFDSTKVIDLFKKNLEADQEISISSLDRIIDWSYDYFLKHRENLPQAYFTFGKLPWMFLHEKDFENQSTEAQWEAIITLRNKLEDPDAYYITSLQNKATFSLLSMGDVIHTYSEPLEAITEFYNRSNQQQAFVQEEHRANTDLAKRIKSCEQFIKKNVMKLEELRTDNRYKIWADLIMANLHQIAEGSTTVSLQDFYHDLITIDVPLKPTLSPQKNAELYYSKSKKQHLEVEHLQRAIETKEKELDDLREQMEQLAAADNLKALRSVIKKEGLEKKEQQPPLPFHEVEFKGFRILIGKNAKSNDMLTLKHTFKDDLWLHAKDVAGSHVVIKYQSGKPFPKDVIERAAQLAAFYSKRKTDSLCPVAVTPKKYVRKRKGDPAGLVVVEREDVVMVEPAGIS